MKQLFLHFAICLSIAVPFSAIGQNSTAPIQLASMDSSIVWELGMSFAEITGQPSRLLYGRLTTFATDRSSLGLHFAFFQRRTNETFNQDVIAPQLNYGEIGLVAAHNFWSWRRFSLGVETVAGFASAKLSDRAVTETQYMGYVVDDIVIVSEQQVPTVVTRNRYFQFKPELTATFRFNRYVGIEASGGYNFLFGKSRFGKPADFDGLVARAGVVLIIPTDEQGN